MIRKGYSYKYICRLYKSTESFHIGPSFASDRILPENEYYYIGIGNKHYERFNSRHLSPFNIFIASATAIAPTSDIPLNLRYFLIDRIHLASALIAHHYIEL